MRKNKQKLFENIHGLIAMGGLIYLWVDDGHLSDLSHKVVVGLMALSLFVFSEKEVISFYFRNEDFPKSYKVWMIFFYPLLIFGSVLGLIYFNFMRLLPPPNGLNAFLVTLLMLALGVEMIWQDQVDDF